MKGNNYLDGKISAREFLVDFFGSLMPGVFFTIFFVITVGLSAFVLFSGVLSIFFNIGYSDELNVFFQAKKFLIFFFTQPSTITILVLFPIALGFSYTIGTIFYRRDVKIPDHKSFIRTIKSFSKEDEVKEWIVRVPKKKLKVDKVSEENPGAKSSSVPSGGEALAKSLRYKRAFFNSSKRRREYISRWRCSRSKDKVLK
ncbi:MAG: hypothetical protein AAF433_21970 [Bacteroidota bacterium]